LVSVIGPEITSVVRQSEHGAKLSGHVYESIR
jgi:hypothetical protein